MRITFPSVLMLTLILAACGGGSGSTTQDGSVQQPGAPSNPQPGTPTPQEPANMLIEYYGDSTVWGCATFDNGCSVAVATTAPEAFEAALPATPTMYAVENKGVSNTDACELRDGTDGRNEAWPMQMQQSQADIVIINHGINHRGESISAYRTCLSDLARIAKENQKTVIFETPNPIAFDGFEQYVQTMRDVAAQEQVYVIDQYDYLMGRYGGDVSQIAPDGLHPSDEVYIVKGQNAAQQFLNRPR